MLPSRLHATGTYAAGRSLSPARHQFHHICLGSPASGPQYRTWANITKTLGHERGVAVLKMVRRRARCKLAAAACIHALQGCCCCCCCYAASLLLGHRGIRVPHPGRAATGCRAAGAAGGGAARRLHQHGAQERQHTAVARVARTRDDAPAQPGCAALPASAVAASTLHACLRLRASPPTACAVVLRAANHLQAMGR